MLYSRGRYVSFVDSDDILSPYRFERIVQFMDSHPEVMHVETTYMRYFTETNTVWNRSWVKGVGTGTMRRAVIDQLGYFLPMLAGADFEYSERIRKHYGPRASCFLRDFTYWAVQRDGNLTNQFPIGGDARLELRDFVNSHLHGADDQRIAFPFEGKLIEQVRHLKLFSLSAAMTAPPKAPTPRLVCRNEPKPAPTSVELLMKLLALSEQCNSIFYANFLTQAQENKRAKAARESNKNHRKTRPNLHPWFYHATTTLLSQQQRGHCSRAVSLLADGFISLER